MTHTYALDALYTVTVKATDEDGTTGMGSTQVNVFRAGYPGNTTATYYNLTAPNPSIGGVGIPSGSFTVGLPNGRYVSSPVTVNFGDGGAGGKFTPFSVVLSNTNPTATFTYTPAQAGSITIAATDNGGLTNPAPVNFTAQSLVTTYTLTGPGSGTVESPATFTATLGPGWLNNPVVLTPSASNGDGTFSPSSVTLSNTNRSATFTYTPTLYDVRNIVTTNNGNLSDPTPFAFVSDVQLGSSGMAPAGNTTPDLGGFNFFTTGPFWQALGAAVTNDAVAPNSSELISSFGPSAHLQISWFGSTADGGNSIYGEPFNVVSGNQPLLPLTLGEYASESDPGPVPFYPNMSIESWPSDSEGDSWITGANGTVTLSNGSAVVYGTNVTFTTKLLPGDTIVFGDETTQYTVQSIQSDTQLTLTQPYVGSLTSGVIAYGPFNRPPAPGDIDGDYHGNVMVRNEATGGIAELYEYYQVDSPDGGLTWEAAGGPSGT